MCKLVNRLVTKPLKISEIALSLSQDEFSGAVQYQGCRKSRKRVYGRARGLQMEIGFSGAMRSFPLHRSKKHSYAARRSFRWRFFKRLHEPGRSHGFRCAFLLDSAHAGLRVRLPDLWAPVRVSGAAQFAGGGVSGVPGAESGATNFPVRGEFGYHAATEFERCARQGSGGSP